ncbi:MAG: thermonuclease family protein [SAR324 cluster bacterium]|nr:thermonuclease family protein [SAR324 cluster bacterium]
MIIQVQELKAQEGLLKTESIRQKLFSRMDNRKKSKPLRTGIENILIGIFSRVTDSESVWIRIENRSEFRKWTFKLSKQNLNLPRQEVRVWLKFVSPKLSVSHGKEYNEWFRKKAAFEMQKIFYNRQVRINYDFSEKLFRLDGIIRSGDTNINIWLIRNGWSFYLLGNETPPEHEDMLAAENEAKQRQVGLWDAELQ